MLLQQSAMRLLRGLQWRPIWRCSDTAYFHGGRYVRIIENHLAGAFVTFGFYFILRRNWYKKSQATPPAPVVWGIYIFRSSLLFFAIDALLTVAPSSEIARSCQKG